jgi:hypothetical protein
MKNLAKITVCVVLMFSALNMFAKNKDRALVINNYGGDIYCKPNAGSNKTINKGDSHCMVASSSKETLKSIKICSKVDQDIYTAYIVTHNSTTGRLAAQVTLDAVSTTSTVKHGQIAVVTNSGTKLTSPSVIVYQNWSDYLAKNPGAKVPSGVSCPHVLP